MDATVVDKVRVGSWCEFAWADIGDSFNSPVPAGLEADDGATATERAHRTLAACLVPKATSAGDRVGLPFASPDAAAVVAGMGREVGEGGPMALALPGPMDFKSSIWEGALNRAAQQTQRGGLVAIGAPMLVGHDGRDKGVAHNVLAAAERCGLTYSDAFPVGDSATEDPVVLAAPGPAGFPRTMLCFLAP